MTVPTDLVITDLRDQGSTEAAGVATVVQSIVDNGIAISLSDSERDLLSAAMAATDQHPVYFTPSPLAGWWAVRSDLALSPAGV